MKSERLLEISLILLNRGMISSPELAERFGVSERTIYRDIEALCEAGIPIASFPGRNGGYGLVEGFKMDRQLLKPDELSAMTTTLEGVAKAFDDPRWAQTIEKLKSLSSRAPDGRRKPEDYLFIDLGQDPRSRRWMSVVRRGIEEDRVVALRYLDIMGRETSRHVEPCAMILWMQTWYLYAFCRLRAEWRMFRMSRVRDAALLPERFLPRPIDLQSRPWERESGGAPVRLELRFAPQTRVLAEDFFGPDILVEEEGGSVRATVDFPETDWLYRFLLGFGKGVEILGPPSVRTTYAAIVADIHASLAGHGPNQT